eukprot:Seg235.5 transcript_id=Seg235.5/GoldUCD/mRNA.D3Y31 product="Glutamine-rich protein 2" protein_id=Seg235.5/GoldUCD/D3Y31
MATKIELGSLLDLAIGKPEIGAVNFKTLHSFLQKLLSHLAVASVQVEVSADKYDDADSGRMSADGSITSEARSVKFSQDGGMAEERIRRLEDKMNLLDSFSKTDDILRWIKGQDASRNKVSDMWNLINLQKRVEGTENGVKRVGIIVDKLLSQLKDVTDVQERMFKMEKRMDELEKLKEEMKKLRDKISLLVGDTKVAELVEQLNSIKNKMMEMPQKKDLEIFVQWPHLQSALETGVVDNNKLSISSDKSSKSASDVTVGGAAEDDESSSHPTSRVLYTLKELGGLAKEHRALKEEVEKLKSTMKHVVDEHSRKQQLIDALYKATDKLEESKLDKEDLYAQLSTKANKTDLDNYVNRQRFDANVGRIDDTLKELIDKVQSNDESVSRIINKLLSEMQGKLDRDEFLDFKEQLESRLKALKLKHKEEQMMDEDPAAAFKKAMLQFNCLSCDRPVYFSGNGPIQGYSGMAAGRSGRPYTSYDLEQFRLLQKGSLKPDQDYASYRSCGGSHTSGGAQTRRISAKLNSYAASYEEVPVPLPKAKSEVDIQGQDGKLYKGRIDKNEELPEVNQRQPPQQNNRMRTKSAHGARTPNSTSPGDGSFVPRRPKTASNRSTTPEHYDRQQLFRRKTPSPEPEPPEPEQVEIGDA